ncbi:MAG: protoheme IX farnesyltransferase [Cellvibrionales bacterium TMED49]|nr:protoheme IX farnesyltransferase [Porticoccaceae bacterium]OUU38458.1 MAG: protoheme IX farnesyltransferase [Cellvibrionales bacterium TMED49]|tara:strand:- start:3729 stop:4646 length:918 start_codon:yes stop_codon:yes gene_type:complete
MNSQSDVNIDPAGWRDYLELCKPNVVALMILTSLIGMLLATDQMVPLDVLLLGNLGIALSAGSAAAVNHIVDQHVDELMARTANRPIARGRVTVRQAIRFATATGVSGLFILIIFINPLTAWLTLGSLVGYAFIYTMYLKRATPQNIVIGGIAGAAPPLLGWTAVTGEIHHDALLLVLIIFAWTPPHFWALAVHRKDEYAKADIPMLPVTHGEKYTKIHILLYTLILLVVSVMPFLTGMLGWLYLVGALSLGIGFIFYSLVMLCSEGGDSGMKTFNYSIVYLISLFCIMLLDHYVITVSYPFQFI